MDLKRIGAAFARTPMHPQWHMPRPRLHPATIQNTGTVLDIGSASQWARRQLPKVTRYIPLDYPRNAGARYKERPEIFADAQLLPFVNDSLDAVICREVMEHLPEPLSALREISRVLRPGGIADCSMPFLYPIHDAPYDYSRWTPQAWSKAADACGLVIVDVAPLSHPLGTAAVVLGLALAEPLRHRTKLASLAMLPFAIGAVTLINLATWGLALVWPRWGGIATGFRIALRKPG